MKKLFVCLTVFCFVGSLSHVRAQILFSDSFENDSLGYNNPNSTSNPAWGGLVYSGGNAQPSQVRPVSGSGFLGADGAQFMELDFSGSGVGTSISPLSTVGTFSANTTYTLSDLMAQNFGGGGNGHLFTGTLTIEDATTSTSVASFTLSFANAPDGNFNSYSTAFDTATLPSVQGDAIQIILSGTSNAGSFQSIEYDNVVLNATTDVPEPSTYALLGLGCVLLCLSKYLSSFGMAVTIPGIITLREAIKLVRFKALALFAKNVMHQ